ncbi:Nicotinate phosphoribosyltransferase 2 [Nymphaea thermarum]|nr:Nicotinate phosphoribosyltransferase 2 [Nymphaea thermarum]
MALVSEEEEEAKSLVFSSDVDSGAPGPDGLPASFFQAYWHLVGTDVVRVGERILCRHPFSESKRAYVVPKRVEELLKCYWPGKSGKQGEELPPLSEIRERCMQQLDQMRPDHLRKLNPTPYKVRTGYMGLRTVEDARSFVTNVVKDSLGGDKPSSYSSSYCMAFTRRAARELLGFEFEITVGSADLG